MEGHILGYTIMKNNVQWVVHVHVLQSNLLDVSRQNPNYM